MLRMDSEIDQWLKPQAIADELDVSVDTVLKLIHDEELEAARIGNQWRVRRRALNVYIAQHLNRKETSNTSQEE